MQHIGDASQISETLVLFEETHLSIKTYVDSECLRLKELLQEELKIESGILNDSIDKTFLTLSDKLAQSILILSGSLIDMEKRCNENLESEGKKLITVWYDKFVSLEDSLRLEHNFLTKEIEESSRSLNARIDDNADKITINSSYLKLLEFENIERKNEISEIRENIINLTATIISLLEKINNVSATKQDIKKPWYKRIFGK